MESTTRLHAQIATSAGVDKKVAQVAAYLLDLSRTGRSLDDAATLMRQGRAFVRNYARDWGIPFPDYTPAPPVHLEWRSEERGHLALYLGAEHLAGIFHGENEKIARWLRPDTSLSERAKSLGAAARKLSLAIENRSLELLGADDILITMPGPGGVIQTVVPQVLGQRSKLIAALAAKPIGRSA